MLFQFSMNYIVNEIVRKKAYNTAKKMGFCMSHRLKKRWMAAQRSAGVETELVAEASAARRLDEWKIQSYRINLDPNSPRSERMAYKWGDLLISGWLKPVGGEGEEMNKMFVWIFWWYYKLHKISNNIRKMLFVYAPTMLV